MKNENETYTFSFETHIGPIQYSAETTVSQEELVKLGEEAFRSHLHRSGNSAAEAALRKEFKLGDKVHRNEIPFTSVARAIVEKAITAKTSYPKNSVFRNGANIEVTVLDEQWVAKEAAQPKYATAKALIELAIENDAVEKLAEKVGYQGVGELNEENENFVALVHKVRVLKTP